MLQSCSHRAEDPPKMSCLCLTRKLKCHLKKLNELTHMRQENGLKQQDTRFPSQYFCISLQHLTYVQVNEQKFWDCGLQHYDPHWLSRYLPKDFFLFLHNCLLP
jgi:hypothetical protein